MIELKTTMYDFQKQGADKMLKLKIGALFMDMGTGKTRLALELVCRRLEAGKVKHVLWLCPCTMLDLGDLECELDKHATDWRQYITLCGIESLSQSRRKNSILLRLVQNVECFLIVDESLKVKNPFALRSKNIERLSRYCRYKLILNGTPVSKCEADLFQQFYILDPRILGYKSYYSFSANHIMYDERHPGKIARMLNVDYLTNKIAPYSYEVRKTDVLNLKDKKYIPAPFYLTEEQRYEYERAKMDFLSLKTWDAWENNTIIYRTFTALQQVTSGRKITTPADKSLHHIDMFSDPMENPRVEALCDVLDKIGQSKVVIWCEYTHEIKTLQKVIKQKYGVEPALCYGAMTKKQRAAERARFEDDTQYFIINKDCASFGLNLQFCSCSVFYNNDWDWATRGQAEDRLHRAGQENTVMVYNLYAVDTIDVRILSCVSRKESLATEFRKHLHKKNFYEWLDGKEDPNDKNRLDTEAKTS